MDQGIKHKLGDTSELLRIASVHNKGQNHLWDWEANAFRIMEGMACHLLLLNSVVTAVYILRRELLCIPRWVSSYGYSGNLL